MINVLTLDDFSLFHCFYSVLVVLITFHPCNSDVSKGTYKSEWSGDWVGVLVAVPSPRETPKTISWRDASNLGFYLPSVIYIRSD